jgi:hypothetical protein
MSGVVVRTNVEQRFFPILRKLVRESKLNKQFVLGSAVFLWSNSQYEKAAEGSYEDILHWCELNRTKKAAKLINFFVYFGILEKKTENIFRIKGNISQIDSINKYHERTAKGGESTKKRWEQIKKDARAKDKPEAMLQASLSENISDSSLTLNSYSISNSSNPPTPLRKGEADLIIAKAVGALHQKISDTDEARTFVGEQAWSLLMTKYATWENFYLDYAKAYSKNAAFAFEAQLRRQLRALIGDTQDA